jgi:uncharacterized repeat protein (TIGR01451 family)
MKKKLPLFIACLCAAIHSFALDVNHFTITRITAPYFVVDGNTPATLTKAYVGFEVKNNSNSATTYSNLRFTITSITTSVAGQNYAIISPASGIVNIGTLAPGETKVCYFYVSYPANVTPQGTFNVQLSDNTASWKTQSFVIRNRSSISANAGGAATQTFTNQDLIGGTVIDDVTYAVGNVQNGDESDFQVAVSAQFDPTKVTLLGTQVISSTVPGVTVGTTDSLYFITGNGSTGAAVTIRWTFRITGVNFTTSLLPCAGATSGATNYKYALNTSLGTGSPVTVSAAANPLTITKTSDQPVYMVNAPAVFTVTINNPGAYPITIDKITDELPVGFSYVSLYSGTQVTASNSTSVPGTGATGIINFEGGVTTVGNTSYLVPAGGSYVLKYSALAAPAPASNLLTTARDYVGSTEVGAAQNTVAVSATLPVSVLSFTGAWQNETIRLSWTTSKEINSQLFEIERNTGNGSYTKIGELPAVGNTNDIQVYSFTDLLPAASDNKYRLKMIDRDGHYTYSAIVFLHKKQSFGSSLSSHPNPFASALNIQFTSDKNQSVQLMLMDMMGKTIINRQQLCIKGANTFILEELATVPAGIYLLQLHTASEKLQQQVVRVK